MSTQSTISRSYTIQEAAKLSGLPESTLRYYESIGIINPIGRDASSKHRIYSEEDINTIDSIACLNATGMSLADMRMYLMNRTRGKDGAQQEIELLTKQKQILVKEAERIKVRQKYVDLKIAFWEATADGYKEKTDEYGAAAHQLISELKDDK